MPSDSQDNFDAINEIRERALMLSLGNEYLCKDIFLKKIGVSIALSVKELAGDISILKKKFPGKFANASEAEQILKGIYGTARRLQQPDEEISEKCSIGSLGRELEVGINSLAGAVKTMRLQIGEEVPVFTEPEAVPERPLDETVTIEIEKDKPAPTKPKAPAADEISIAFEEAKAVHAEPEVPATDEISMEIEEAKPVHAEPEVPVAHEISIEIEEEMPVYDEPEALTDDDISVEFIEEEPSLTPPEPPPMNYIRLPIEEQARVYPKPKAPAAKPVRVPAKDKKRVRKKTVVLPSPFGLFRSLVRMIADLFRLMTRLFVTLTLVPALAILISVLPITYLYLTMDTEEALLKEISRNQSYIQSQQEILATLDYQKEQISSRIESMASRDMTRQEKVEVMDYYVNMHKLEEERNKVQAEIMILEEKISEKEEKIEVIKQKSFIEKFLRL